MNQRISREPTNIPRIKIIPKKPTNIPKIRIKIKIKIYPKNKIKLGSAPKKLSISFTSQERLRLRSALSCMDSSPNSSIMSTNSALPVSITYSCWNAKASMMPQRAILNSFFMAASTLSVYVECFIIVNLYIVILLFLSRAYTTKEKIGFNSP